MSISNLIKSFAAVFGVFFLLPTPNVLAQTTSPFEPPEEELGIYVVNSGSGLDTGCTFRSGGPLRIMLDIPMIVNPQQVNPDGTLIDPSKMVNNGVISQQAVLRFPVFDIDSGANFPNVAPEVDRILFNGKFQKVLSGVNNQWTDDSIVIPIDLVKFGQTNEITVEIDTANTSEAWCMAVDWVAIEMDVAAPYVLAHGINSDLTTWDDANSPGVLARLDDFGVLYTRFSVTSNGRSANNARQLRTNITRFLEPLEAKKVNVIAHSKGGLDTQALQALGPDFEILSLSTLSTPHLGSSAADLSIIQKTQADERLNSGADPNGHATRFVNTWTFGQGPQLPGLRDLTTYYASQAIANNIRGNIGKTFTIGAFADANNDGDLVAAESRPLFPRAAHYAAERAWNVLRNVSSATTVRIQTRTRRNFLGFKTRHRVLTYHSNQTTGPLQNDIVVTVQSANPGYGTPLGNAAGNHTTVRSVANINRILNRTVSLR